MTGGCSLEEASLGERKGGVATWAGNGEVMEKLRDHEEDGEGFVHS